MNQQIESGLAFSQACENNKQVILEVLQLQFPAGHRVLEIGSGTAQHAVYFAANMPDIVWQCADQKSFHSGINQRVAIAALPNLFPALQLETISFDWSVLEVESFFSANTAHIMSWEAVEAMFNGVGSKIAANGKFILYGPFNRDGKFTSESNRLFHLSLQNRDPQMGLRDDRDLIALASGAGLRLTEDIAMPANNRILVWQR